MYKYNSDRAAVVAQLWERLDPFLPDERQVSTRRGWVDSVGGSLSRVYERPPRRRGRFGFWGNAAMRLAGVPAESFRKEQRQSAIGLLEESDLATHCRWNQKLAPKLQIKDYTYYPIKPVDKQTQPTRATTVIFRHSSSGSYSGLYEDGIAFHIIDGARGDGELVQDASVDYHSASPSGFPGSTDLVKSYMLEQGLPHPVSREADERVVEMLTFCLRQAVELETRQQSSSP